MNAKTLAELALKVWSVLLVIDALLSLPVVLSTVWAVPPDDAQAAFIRASQIGYVLNVVVQALGGIIVLVWADRIVALFESDVTPLDIDLSGAQFQVLAFAIAGVFVLIDGLENASAAGYALLTKPGNTDTLDYMWARQGESMVRGVVQIAAGAGLIFGREALGRGWSRLRSQPASQPADADDAG